MAAKVSRRSSLSMIPSLFWSMTVKACGAGEGSGLGAGTEMGWWLRHYFPRQIRFWPCASCPSTLHREGGILNPPPPLNRCRFWGGGGAFLSLPPSPP